MENKWKMSARHWVLLWTIGLAGQICWNIENQWFNTFIYEKIAPDANIISWMVAISAIATAFSTFFFGTLSDRMGKRKPFIAYGYILWGIFTIIYGTSMYFAGATSVKLVVVASFVILADAIMSFCGSMGNDSGFNAWCTDMLDDKNRGGIGATLAAQPVLGTIIGTVVGGMVIQAFGYMAFFAVMGIIVILIGLLTLWKMKDVPSLKPKKEGTFWQQFFGAFNFKKFFKHRELVFVNLVIAVFFIAFNVYFVHIGNLFIYNYGFSEGDAGLIQGVGLVIAILFTIPAISLINKDKSPLVLISAIVVDIIGLLVLWLFSAKSDSTALFSLSNLPLFIGIILAGIGYVLVMQTTMVWSKKLYPEGEKGQYEGIRIIFFVLIPMIVGPMIANPIIKNAGKEFTKEYASGFITGQVPTETLFVVAAIITVLTLIPAFFAIKEHNKRLKLAKKSN